MADILRVAVARAGLSAARIAVHLVETSPVLRKRQAETLRRVAAAIALARSRSATCRTGPLLLVANEFFDALPIRQFVRADGEWRERVVGLDADGRLAFGLGAGPTRHGAGTRRTERSSRSGRPPMR